MEMPPFIQINRLCKSFSAEIIALDEINLNFQQSDFVAIIGPSGCGKSTLLRLIAGLVSPTIGDITIGGKSPQEALVSSHDLAFVFQEATLLPWRTIRENVCLPMELLQLPYDSKNVDDLLALVGLTEFADARPHQLSGGMKMRASLARALINKPDVLLLDEPFGALDEITRQRLNEELLKLWELHRWLGLFVTHNVFEAVYLSRRVLIMSSRPGRIAGDFIIPFGYPRTPELRSDPEFAQLAGQISRKLREVW